MAPSRIEACSLPSSSVPRSFDVFLSFRGEDTRNTFISHLYTSLSQAELHTFRDDDEIERGKDIKRELEKTIRQSKVAVIVFSANYASSSWCLDELVLINERKKAGLCDILPIFYHVAPDLVRNQKGSFDEAFAKHEERYKDKLQKWRSALKEVADLKGEVLKTDQNEAHFIQSIVKSVRNMLDCKLFDVEPYSVDRISDLNDSTGDWALRVRVLRIWRVMQPKNSNNLKSIEMVLQDQKGDRIQASMAKYIVVKFESLIEELGTYVMRSFIVHANKGNLKPTNHKFKLALFNKTEVERIANFDFECDMFNLRPYHSLLNIKNFDETELFDVIGEVIPPGKPRQNDHGDNSSKLMNLILQDHRMNRIPVTFWGEFVDQILPYLNSQSETIVVVMQLVRGKKFKERIDVQNTWHISKL